MALVSVVKFFGKTVAVICDGNCGKAWGINGRPREQLSEDIDDYAWLADGELGTAPHDTGISEGDEVKPVFGKAHNKWCVRECERSRIVEHGQRGIEPPCFDVRQYNMPQGHKSEKE